MSQPASPAAPLVQAPDPVVPEHRKYSSFGAVFRCMSANVWLDVAQNWRGVGVFYMLLVLTLSYLPAFVTIYAAFCAIDQDFASRIIMQIPTIRIASGAVTMDRPSPYYIRDPQRGGVLAIIDTSGQTTTLPKGAVVLLTRDSLILRRGDTARTASLSMINSFSMDRTSAAEKWALFRTWFIPAVFSFVLLGSLIVRLIVMLVLATFGAGRAMTLNATLSLAGAMRLSAVTMTPIIALLTIIDLSGIGFTLLWMILGLVAEFALLLHAIKVISPRLHQMQPDLLGVALAHPQEWAALQH